jgi:DNA-directed RNA polymerase subunit RPC12/RpoP
MANTVQLSMVWAWDCPECKHKSLHAGRVCRDEEVIADAKEELGSFEPGELMEMPMQVACQRCGAVFPVEPPEDMDQSGEGWKP